MKILPVVLFLLICSSCVGTDPYVMDKLGRVDSMIPFNPDSSQVVLDGISQEDLRSDESRARYALLRTIVDNRLGNVHRSTDNILRAKEYYVDAKTPDSLLAIVHLYTGRVYQDLGEHEKALEEYLAARMYAEKTENNSYWKGRIAFIVGYMYHRDDDFIHASDYLKDATIYFKESDNELDLAHSYYLYGFNLYLLNNLDWALDAIEKSDIIYRKLNRTDGLLENAVSRSGVYFEMGNILSAESVMVNAHRNFNQGTIPLEHIPHISRIENAKGNHLKAAELLEDYLNRSPELPLSKRASLIYLISTYLKDAGQYQHAHTHADNYIALLDSLYADEVVTALQEVEKRYEKQTLEKEYANYRNITTYKTALVLLGSGVVMFFLTRLVISRKRKITHLQADLEGMKSQINEFDNLKKNLSEMLNEKNEKEARLHDVLTNKMLQVQKIVDYLYLYENDPDKFQSKVSSAIIQTEKDGYFGELQEIVNEKYAGIVLYLKATFPDLTEAELNLCCLLCFGFSNNQIGILFGYTNPYSIFNKRHQLRKKMGLWPNYESLETFLAQTIENLRKEKV